MLTTGALLFSAVTLENTCAVEVFAIPASVEPDSSCTSAFTWDSCKEFE